MTHELVPSESLTYNVCMAIEDEQRFLPIDEDIFLESLNKDDDGIFPTPASWKAFVNGNFRSYGELYLGGEPKESFLKKWCRPLEDYENLFITQVGSSLWAKVSASDLEFTYDYDLNYFEEGDDFPSRVEIYVTAEFK